MKLKNNLQQLNPKYIKKLLPPVHEAILTHVKNQEHENQLTVSLQPIK